MKKIDDAVKYFDKQVGHYSDKLKVVKLREEVEELSEAIDNKSLNLYLDDYSANASIIDECSDVQAVAFHTATIHGYKGTPNDLFLQAYEKMKGRIERGERDYINKDF